jgi:DNA-binding MarR family transcriptional regulator
MTDGKYTVQNRAQTLETTLDVLDAVSTDESMSQRRMAERLGIALGLTNAVLKRCLKKGLLKIREAPARRYAYYLTPKGFAEKSRLTAEYLGTSLQFYREARQGYAALFTYCTTRGWPRVFVVGATDLAEIATLAASEAGISIAGVIDPKRNESSFCGVPVYRSIAELDGPSKPSAVVLADITDPQAVYSELVAFIPDERILAPDLLRLTRRSGPK